MKLRSCLSAVLTASFLMIFAAPASAQWTWLNPKPQGHNLYDVEFLTDTVAIAVGEGATIAVTNDGGSTWSYSPQINGLTATLWQVAAIDANTAVAVGDGAVVLRTINGGASWTQVASGATSNLRRVDFAGPSGIAVGSSGVRRSIDGGQTWTGVQTGFTVEDLDVVTPTLAFVVTTAGVLKSTDNGLTWSFTGFQDLLPTGPRIAFADPLNGVVSSPIGGTSGGGSYYFTSDGGQNWVRRDGPGAFIHSGYSTNEMILVASQLLFVAASGGACDPGTLECSSWGDLFQTTNGGSSWDSDEAPRPLFGLARNSGTTFLAVGEGGNIWRWETPSTWQQLGGTQYDRFDGSGAISFADPSTGIVSGLNFVSGGGPTQTMMLRTSTAGSTWSGTLLYATVVNDFTHARGANPPAYGVGRIQINGILYTAVLKSTDNGATWPLLWSATPYTALQAIDFASATHGLAVGNSGRVAVIDNDVVTLGTIAGGGTLTGVAFADASVAVAIGSSGLFRTTNGGTTWSSVPAPAGARNGIGFASSNVGVAVGNSGAIMRSADGGLTWQPVTSPTTSSLIKVSFSSATYGMIAGANGTLLETGDGGQTWTVIPSPTPSAFLDLACLGAKHAYVVSWDLRVLEYRENTVPTLFSAFEARPRELAAELRWSVQDEANLAGFRVIRRDASSSVVVAEPDARQRAYRDASVRPGATYDYTLVAVEKSGEEIVSMPAHVTIPQVAANLLPNQPNPFNPETTIRFVVPEKMRVTISVHDVAGRVVATLVDDVREPGMNSITWNAQGMASGIYFARMHAGKTDVSRKMVLLK
jgi:photosystem II stability/assembly factor-like uncharacterized protein